MSNIDIKNLDDSRKIVLSEKSNEAIKQIRAKLRKTAETIIEIGELLIEAIDGKAADYKKEFYKQLGMSERSALRYMQIARSEAIQKLKNEKPKLLDNMTMSDLIHEMNKNNKTAANSDEKSDTEASDTDSDKKPSKKAQDIFKRYKNDTDTLEEIIMNLQKMLEEHKKESTAIDATIVTSENK